MSNALIRPHRSAPLALEQSVCLSDEGGDEGSLPAELGTDRAA